MDSDLKYTNYDIDIDEVEQYAKALSTAKGHRIIVVLITKLLSIIKKSENDVVNRLEKSLEINELKKSITEISKLSEEKNIINHFESIIKICKTSQISSEFFVKLAKLLITTKNLLKSNNRLEDDISQEISTVFLSKIDDSSIINIDYNKQYYIALPVQVDSDLKHITLAFNINKLDIDNIGCVYDIEYIGLQKTIEISERKYTFQPIRYRKNGNVEWTNGHITINAPLGHAKDLHPWCADPKNQDIFLSEITHNTSSIALFFNKTGPLANQPIKCSFDFDQTLVNCKPPTNSESMDWLHDGSLLKEPNTSFTKVGIAINNCGIKFDIVTSRRDKMSSLEDPIRKLFPNVNIVSFCKKRIVAQSEKSRMDAKAEDKLARVIDLECFIHFDDENIVCNKMISNGISSVLVNSKDNKFMEVISRKIHQFGIQGPPGIGKSTILEKVATKLEIMGYKTKIYATDSYNGCDAYACIQSDINNDRNNIDIALWDTTFSSGPGKLPIKLVKLSCNNIESDFLVSLLGILGRESHPNLSAPAELFPNYKKPDYNDERSLVSILNKHKDNISEIKQELASIFVNIRIIDHSYELIVICSYLERAQNFRDLAMRQSRNPILVFDTETQSWLFLANQFIRGAESLSIQTKDMQTENVNNCSLDCISEFSGPQQRVMIPLLDDKETQMNGYLSFKADGQLVGISWTKTNTKMGIKTINIINNCNNDFAKYVLNCAIKNKWDYIPVIRSNGTYFISDDMIITLYTALKSQYESKFPDKNDLPSDINELRDKLIPDFLNQSYIFINNIVDSSDSDLICMSFEAICPDRKTLSGKILIELACSYPQGSIRFLGYSKGQANSYPKYTCHGECQDAIFKAELDQPLFKTIKTNNEINQSLSLLNQVTKGEISEDEFFSKWAPDNFETALHIIDPEGFVFNTIDGEYSKIKTRTYYICHKLRLPNIVELLEMPQITAKYFPLVSALKRVIGEDRILLKQVTNIAIDFAEKFLNMYNVLASCNGDNPQLSEDMTLFWNSLSSKAQSSLITNVIKPNPNYNNFLVRFSGTNDAWYSLLEKLFKKNDMDITDIDTAIIAIKRLFLFNDKYDPSNYLSIASPEIVRLTCECRYNLEMNIDAWKIKKEYETIIRTVPVVKNRSTTQNEFIKKHNTLMNSACFLDIWASTVGGISL